MGSYAPRNYDRGYRGIVSLRTALASSLNVPAVRTCLLVSPDAFAVRLRRMGFDGVGKGEDHGASLALGSADLTLFQLVNAYATRSKAKTSHSIEEIGDCRGVVIER